MTARPKPHLPRPVDLCPDSETGHTPCPSRYLDWHEWAERMSATHVQRQCPTCGFWAIWDAS